MRITASNVSSMLFSIFVLVFFVCVGVAFDLVDFIILCLFSLCSIRNGIYQHVIGVKLSQRALRHNRRTRICSLEYRQFSAFDIVCLHSNFNIFPSLTLFMCLFLCLPLVAMFSTPYTSFSFCSFFRTLYHSRQLKNKMMKQITK